MSIFARILGVLHAPRATFRDVVRTPYWLGILAWTCLLSAGASAVVLETEVGQLALLDRWERAAVAFGQPLDDSRYAVLGAASEHGGLYAVASAVAIGPVLSMVVAGLLVVTLRTTSSTATYTHALAVTTHAGVILALRQIIAAPVSYARDTLASPLTLRLFFSGLDEASIPVRLSSAIDLFVVWWIITLAIGSSVLYRRPARRLAMAFLGTYLAFAALVTSAMVLLQGASAR